KFPVLFLALADGRLNVSGLVMLARHLTLGNVGELLAAASRKTNEEIARLLAERFPRPDLPERLVAMAALPVAPAGLQDSARNPDALFSAVSSPAPTPEDSVRNPLTTLPPSLSPLHDSPGSPVWSTPRGRVTPLSPRKFGFQFTGDQETHDLYEQFRGL